MNNEYRIMRAIEFASEAHKGQKRNDGVPYILHPIGVATMLAVKYRRPDKDLICMALLHDVIEDCTPKGWEQDMIQRIEYNFGSYVTKGVCMLSKNLAKQGKDGKVDLDAYFMDIACANSDIRAVKIVDRIHNIFDMRGWKTERINRYLQETKKYILPIALHTDRTMAQDIKAILHKYQMMGYKP